MGRLSEKDSSVLLQDLKRSDSPIAHAVRARTPDLQAGLERGRLSDSVEPQTPPTKSQGVEQLLQVCALSLETFSRDDGEKFMCGPSLMRYGDA